MLSHQSLCDIDTILCVVVEVHKLPGKIKSLKIMLTPLHYYFYVQQSNSIYLLCNGMFLYRPSSCSSFLLTSEWEGAVHLYIKAPMHPMYKACML
jgi:hypothetical protein